MTHETPQKDYKYGTAFRSSFWFVVILAGLFIAAVNFVNVMSHDDGEGHEGRTEAQVHGSANEATSSETLEGESGVGKATDHSTQAEPTGADTTHMEGH